MYRIKLISILLMSFCSFITSPPASAGPVEDELKKTLEVYDDVFLSDYFLEMMAYQPNQADLSFGFSTSTVTLSGDGMRHSLNRTVIQRKDTPYREGLASKAYDGEGNLIVGSVENLSIQINPDGGGVLRNSTIRSISRLGGIPATNKAATPLAESYPSNHPDLLNQYYRYILPLGRGFSRLIDSVETVTKHPDGGLFVKARGYLFSENAGLWELRIDDGNDFLVQSASFWQDGLTEPRFFCHGAGIFQADLKLFSRGTIQFSDYPITVDLKNYRILSDPILLSHVNSLFARMAENSGQATVIDFRQLDSIGMPIIRRLKDQVDRR